MRDQGLLQSSDLDKVPPFPEEVVEYERASEFKMPALRRAAQIFFADGARADRAAYEGFCESASSWLDDYALFMACKDVHHGTAWTSWDKQIRKRDARAVSDWSRKLAPEIQAFKRCV